MGKINFIFKSGVTTHSKKYRECAISFLSPKYFFKDEIKPCTPPHCHELILIPHDAQHHGTLPPPVLRLLTLATPACKRSEHSQELMLHCKRSYRNRFLTCSHLRRLARKSNFRQSGISAGIGLSPNTFILTFSFPIN